jgi:tripartite-type tricarboxylate transporter receptor subunit TctC
MRLIQIGVALTLAALVGVADAQSWPTKPVRMILPFGGGADILARPLAQAVSESLGQQIIVENIVGGQTILGTRVAARAPADGYTILMITNSHAINESMRNDLGYNLLNDFDPVTQLCTFSIALVVNPSVPANTVKELIAYAKANPGKLASASSGPVYQLPTELFKSMTGIDILHVPYKSSANARTDIVSGQVQVMMDGLVSMLPFVQANRVRLLGTGGLRRSGAAPEVPTIAEAGVPGFNGDGWMGYLAPKGTPPAIVERLHKEIAQYLKRPEVRASYLKQATEPVGSAPAEFRTFLREEVERWGKVVHQAGLSPK